MPALPRFSPPSSPAASLGQLPGALACLIGAVRSVSRTRGVSRRLAGSARPQGPAAQTRLSGLLSLVAVVVHRVHARVISGALAGPFGTLYLSLSIAAVVLFLVASFVGLLVVLVLVDGSYTSFIFSTSAHGINLT